MEQPRLVTDWAVRPSTPGPDVPLKALVLYPDEFKPIPARPAEPGLRIARRGTLLIAGADQPRWTTVQSNLDRGAQLVLREPSGRNHEVTLGWSFQPADQLERYGADGLAGLAVAAEDDLILNWRALDLYDLT